MAATEMTVKINLELIQLDPTKCNIVILHMPENSTPRDIGVAQECLAHLREYGVNASLMLPPGWRAELAEQEPKADLMQCPACRSRSVTITYTRGEHTRGKCGDCRHEWNMGE